MNKVYRVIWSRTLRCFIVVHEHAKAFGKASSTVRKGAAAAAVGLLVAGPALAGEVAPHALPTGGQIVAGSGSITRSGAEMIVRQDTARMITNWDSFNIGAEAGVTFRQPDASSVALNRVLGQDPSRILGRLSANGHVMLVNPAGVLFGANSRVNVGGITATTLDIADQDFLSGDYRFTNPGSAASVENHGTITAEGGVVALVAPVVRNEGSIGSHGGSTALAAGDAVTLDFAGDGLVTVTVDHARLDALVANGGAVHADEGVVVLSAGAARDLMAGAVNNEGIVEARGLVADGGRIVLEGGVVTQAGTLDVSSETGRGGRVEIAAAEIALAGDSRIDATGATGGGTAHVGGAWQGGGDVPQARTVTMAEGAVIDASATEQGDGGEIVLWSDVTDAASRTAVAGTLTAEGGAASGNGGRVETSGHELDIAEGTRVSTLAPGGTAGQWLLDPQDFVIAASGGDITGTTLSNNLTAGNVEILSSTGGTAGNGDIFVNDTVSWSANTLTLSAHRSIEINAEMTATNTAGLALHYDQGDGGSGTYKVSAPVNLDSTGSFATKFGSGGGIINYTIITSLGAAGSTTGTDLQGMAGNLSGSYVMGADIDASDTATWNGGNGFEPVGSFGMYKFTGTFDGLGHVITGLTINRPTSEDLGLFGKSVGIVRNVGLEGGSVAGYRRVGSLVGYNDGGTISNSYATTSVTGSGSMVGGLAGLNYRGTVSNSYATGSVTASDKVGGLVGWNSTDGSISNSYATGRVNNTSGSDAGGLVGYISSGSTITASYWDKQTTGKATSAGGGTGLTTADMKDPFTFIDAGWDFANAWGKSRTGNGNGYMVLRAFDDTVYDYYVRLSNTDTSRAYGDANPSLGAITLDGVGHGNVTLAWGGAITATTDVGSYAYTAPNVLAAQLSAGTEADYYFRYGSGALTITQRPVELSGSRAYDGTTGVAASALSLGNLVSGETLTLTGAGSVADKNAGVDKALSLGTLALGDGNGGKASNYTFTGGTHRLTITPRALSLDGLAVATKTYDGDAAAMVANYGNLNNIISGDTVALDHSGVDAAFVDVNAGIGKTVMVGGLALSGGDAGNYTITDHTTTADILPRSVDLSGSRVYDGTTGVAAGALSLGNLVSGETLTLTGAGGIADKNVGSNKALSLGSLALGDGNGGLASNYMLDGGTHRVTISARPVDLSGSRAYDGATDVAASALSLGNLVSGEELTLTGTGSSADTNAGADKALSLGTLALGDGSGGQASNYTFAGGTHVVTITPRALGLSGLTVGNKTYDGSTAATVTSYGNLHNIVSGDAVTLNDSGAAAAFADANAGTGKTVTVGGLALSGGDAGNYSIGDQTTTADVVPRPVDLSGSRAYDGTTDVAANVLSPGNLVSGEDLALTGAGSIADKNVGSDKTLSLGSLALADGNGGLASNYILAGGTYRVTVTPRALGLSGLTVANKTYDGSTAATVTSYGDLANVVTGDVVVLDTSGANAAFADANAGTGKTVTVGGLALSGGDVGNYSIGDQTATTDVLRRSVDLSGSRVYDGTTGVAANVLSLGNLVSGETLTLTGAGVADKNAGVGKALSLGTLALGDGNGGLASNYTLTGGTHAVTINVRPVDLSGSRVYDGTSDVAASVLSLGNLVSGEDLTLTGTGSSADKNAGVGKALSLGTLALGDGNGGLASNYTLTGGTHAVTIKARSVDLSGSRVYDGTSDVAASVLSLGNLVSGEDLTLTGTGSSADKNAGSDKALALGTLALGDGNGGLASNYTFTGGSHAVTINARPVDLSGNRAYDGTTDVAASVLSLGNVVNGEELALTGIGSSADKNVGSDQVLALGTLALGDGNGGLASNYTFTGGSHAVTINARPVDLSGSRAYDGTTDVVASVLSLGNLVSGETLTLTGSGGVADKNVGSDQALSLGSLALGDGNGGLASNYTLAGGTHRVTVGARPVDLSGSRVYDGATDVAASVLLLGNLVSGEELTLTGTGSSADKNAGADKALSLGTLALGDGSGGQASNYTFAGGTHRVTITPRALGLSGLTVGNKTYDGSTAATVTSYGNLHNIVSGDTVVLNDTGAAAAFADANVGTGKTVTVGGLALSGGDAGNYSIAAQTATADVLPRSVDISGSRAYDGATGVVASALLLGNLVSGEELTLTGAGSIADKNVGSDKALSLGTLALGDGNGGLASNYTFTGGTHRVTIIPRALSLSGLTVANKTYDGNAAATVTSYGDLDSVVTSDAVVLDTSGATAAFVDVNAGSGKTVTVSSLALSGGDAGNYSIADQTATADILPAPLTVTANDQSKIYDGQNHAGFTVVYSGFVTGEGKEVLSGTLSFGAAAAAVDAGDYTIIPSGLSAGNYLIEFVDGTLTITPRSLTITGSFEVLDKVFDGTTAATITTNGLFLDNVVAGDAVALAPVAAFAQANVEQGALVQLTRATGLTGAKAANYTLDLTNAPTTTANILSTGNPSLPPSSEVSTTDGEFGASEPLISLVDEQVGVGTDGSFISGEGMGGAIGFRLDLQGDTAVLTVEGGSADGGRETVALPIYEQGTEGIEALTALRVDRDGARWSGTLVDEAPQVVPALAEVAEVQTESFITRLPGGRDGRIEVGVTDDGVLLVRTPAAVRDALGQSQLLLVALLAASGQLDVSVENITAVVVQESGNQP